VHLRAGLSTARSDAPLPSPVVRSKELLAAAGSRSHLRLLPPKRSANLQEEHGALPGAMSALPTVRTPDFSGEVPQAEGPLHYGYEGEGAWAKA